MVISSFLIDFIFVFYRLRLTEHPNSHTDPNTTPTPSAVRPVSRPPRQPSGARSVSRPPRQPSGARPVGRPPRQPPAPSAVSRAPRQPSAVRPVSRPPRQTPASCGPLLYHVLRHRARVLVLKFPGMSRSPLVAMYFVSFCAKVATPLLLRAGGEGLGD